MNEVRRYRNSSGQLVTVNKSDDGRMEMLQTWPRDAEPAVPFEGFAASRAAINAPIRDAVHQVLRDARGFFVTRGFVTSFIVQQLATNFPHVAHVTPRRVRYVLNDLESAGIAERVIEAARHHEASEKVVPVTRWRLREEHR
jgi:hypothetical protein